MRLAVRTFASQSGSPRASVRRVDKVQLNNLGRAVRRRLANPQVRRFATHGTLQATRRCRSRPKTAEGRYMTDRHPLADVGRARCTHTTRPKHNSVEQCREEMIRADERLTAVPQARV